MRILQPLIPYSVGMRRRGRREHIEFMLNRHGVHSWNIPGRLKRQKSQTAQLLIVSPDIGFPELLVSVWFFVLRHGSGF
jgi:hypothetical protein